MYKFLLLIISIVFIGCGTPNPNEKPQWFTDVPVDSEYIYATGIADTQEKAKLNAISNIKVKLSESINNSFRTKNLLLDTKDNLDKILNSSLESLKQLSIPNIFIENSGKFKNKQIILISIEKKNLFNSLKQNTILKAKNIYNITKGNMAINRYIALKKIMKDYPFLASKIELKQVLNHNYNPDNEFKILNQIKNDFFKLKNSISFYILTDDNSKIYYKEIVKAIVDEGLVVSKIPSSKDSIRLLVVSQLKEDIKNDVRYSKNFLRFTSYNINKEQIASNEIVFNGKSKESYKIAKEDSINDCKNKVIKLGIFNIFGFNVVKIF